MSRAPSTTSPQPAAGTVDLVAPPGAVDLDAEAGRIGIQELRPAQRAAVEALVAGRDVLAVIPTGGGKSAIYQVATEILDGVCVVVSPLLALQEDQMDAIASADLGEAVAIDGATSDSERAAIVDRLSSGAARYLFATPEILTDEAVVEALARIGVRLLAVDEAHCIVTWGHGFRPDYTVIGDVRRRLGTPLAVALTGSADPRMRTDICRSLDMAEAEIVTSDLERTNIHLSVVGSSSADDAIDRIVEHLTPGEGKALVYVPTRALTVEIAERLEATGQVARPFHGGLPKSAKSEALGLIRSQQRCVIVATTAFGMGIDVPDITTVVHLDMPDSLLAYYQEVGRGGRDGAPARGAVFVSLRARSRRAFGSGVRSTSVGECAAVYDAMRGGVVSRRRLAEQMPFGAGTVARALSILEQAGAIATRPRLAVTGAVELEVVERLRAEREEFDRSQLLAVERYRSSRHCRWSQILTSLGESLERCGHCDVCEIVTEEVPDREFPVGTVVSHVDFGRGCVTSRRPDVIVVAFDEVGPKELSTELCVEHGLIEADPAATPEAAG
ncbi:RecQ family ATP-dependent DNA helicase [Ilumatobacter sp.]|uniref:RecQ family ATP-dependent DNA helicase n=1 Tax=Ilumatobacter sp. TaxID=1967498 RepID=UPI003B518400